MLRASILLACAGAALGGCGGGADGGLLVSAAASLAEPLRACVPPGTRLQLGGSDQLAAQARSGRVPDVFLAADAHLPRRLARDGVLRAPVVFARNELVVAVAPGAAVASPADLGRGGVRIVTGGDGAPAGRYAQLVLARLPARVRGNVRSREPDVKGVVAKLSAGAADAGFVYRTDARAARLRIVRLPPALRPAVRYAGAAGADAPPAADRFLRDVRAGGCARALRRAGFPRP